MYKTKLTLGTKLELDLYDETGSRIHPTLVSQFEAVAPDNTLEILSPIHEGRIFPVHRQSRMDVIFEKNGDLFKFSAVALERKIVGNLHMLRIKPVTEEEQIQRRYFFRFNCILDLQYRYFDYMFTPPENRGDFEKGITRDISGGGLCLGSRVKPEYGWLVEGVLTANQKIPFIGRVVRVINVQDKGKFNYDVGVEFVEITNMDRERIIGFIFDEQRKLLKKGWTK